MTSAVWRATSSYCLERLLLLIWMCKFGRGCTMQFRGSGASNGRDSGFRTTITHRATRCLLCSNSCYHPATTLSGSHSEWLSMFPTLKNGPQRDTFCSHAGLQIECDGWIPEGSKKSRPPVCPTVVGLMLSTTDYALSIVAQATMAVYWTVVSLTAAMFKSLCQAFAFSRFANILLFMLLNDFHLLPA